MIKFLKTLSADILNFVLPAICISCETPLTNGRVIICESCYSSLRKITPEQANVFIDRLNQRHFNNIFIMFEFSELFQKLMHSFKYDGHQDIARYFAQTIFKFIDNRYDLVTFVPLHKTKERERGFNQSEVIAYFYCQETDLNFSDNILERVKYTKSQTKLDRTKRRENIKDAFSVEQNIENKTILLIDDVITTGATLNECARNLKAAKCKSVDIVAMATPVNILQSALEQD